MTAAAADRNTLSKINAQIKSYPVATATTIYKGTMVAINAAGYVVPASDTAGLLRVVGVADEKVVNAGANGALWIRVISGRSFKFAATSITQAMLGTEMSVVDDQTFDDAAGPTNDIAAGTLIEFVSATEGWLYIPVGGIPA